MLVSRVNTFLLGLLFAFLGVYAQEKVAASANAQAMAETAQVHQLGKPHPPAQQHNTPPRPMPPPQAQSNATQSSDHIDLSNNAAAHPFLKQKQDVTKQTGTAMDLFTCAGYNETLACAQHESQGCGPDDKVCNCKFIDNIFDNCLGYDKLPFDKPQCGNDIHTRRDKYLQDAKAECQKFKPASSYATSFHSLGLSSAFSAAIAVIFSSILI